MSPQKLFQPIIIGDITLDHRVVLSPLTRFRNTREHVPTDLSVEYYSQRASTPGTLLISEAIVIAARAGGHENVPHLETDEQIRGWKKVTDAVHARKSYIFAQLWAFGRAAKPSYLNCEGLDYVGASDIPLNKHPNPRPLIANELREYVQLFARAAINALHHAGFDGVEVHGANGYLVEQFIQDVTNNRTDEYGGSIENRSRFVLEILGAISKAIGTQNKVAIRLSPWERMLGMRMKDPIPTYSYLVKEIATRFPNLAYIHVTEPRVSGSVERDIQEGEGNDFLREIWGSRPFISAGGYNRELAVDVAEKTGNLIAFGRHFIANPDLPMRLRTNCTLNPYDRSTFYKVNSPVGYIDYPFATGLHEPKIIEDADGTDVIHALL